MYLLFMINMDFSYELHNIMEFFIVSVYVPTHIFFFKCIVFFYNIQTTGVGNVT